jgi:hypothetical protein
MKIRASGRQTVSRVAHLQYLGEIPMKKALLILALPLLQFAAVQAFAADAMDASAPKTRAEVKAETKTAISTGKAGQAGEAGPAAIIDKKIDSTKTRAEVKADTKAAAAAGELPKAGEAAATAAVDKKPVSTKTRAEVKASTRAAHKHGLKHVAPDAKGEVRATNETMAK